MLGTETENCLLKRRCQVCCLRPTALTEAGKRIAGISDTLIANETKVGRGETEKCHMPLRPPIFPSLEWAFLDWFIPVTQWGLDFKHLLLSTSKLPQHGHAAFGAKEQDALQTIYGSFYSFILGTWRGGWWLFWCQIFISLLPFSKLICLDDFSDDFSHFPPPDALLRVCSFVHLWGCFVAWMLLHFLSSLRIYADLVNCGNWLRPLL